MAEEYANGIWIIALTFLTALVLMIIPMPEGVPVELGYLRPEWVVLVLIYWVIALPHRVGVIVAFAVGILVDVLMGSLLGLHAISLMVVAYIAMNLYQRLRMFSVWQQSIIILATVGVHQLITFWIESIAGLRDWNLWYLMSAVMSALFWPWIFLALRFLRRQFKVN